MDKLPGIQILPHDPPKEVLFKNMKSIIIKVNEIVEVINSLECDNSLMTPVQHRGGSDA